MAATGVGSIGFMNISLHLNSVGFYQITKLAIVPATLCAQSLLFGVSTSTKIKLSLSVLLLGRDVGHDRVRLPARCSSRHGCRSSKRMSR